MKKLVLVVLLVIMAVALSACGSVSSQQSNIPTPTPHVHDFSERITYEFATCISDGLKVMKCSGCNETETTILPQNSYSHNVEKYTVTKQPTFTLEGEKRGICTLCGQTVTSTIKTLGTYSESPYSITAYTLYNDILRGNYRNYIGKYLEITGTISSISAYSDMTGYYLYGKTGQGVVCWVDGKRNTNLVKGAQVTFIGKVSGGGSDHVEISRCSQK